MHQLLQAVNAAEEVAVWQVGRIYGVVTNRQVCEGNAGHACAERPRAITGNSVGENWTLPVGVVAAVTVAVKVTAEPSSDGFSEETSAVAELAG